jgi:hypothetical protein
MRERVAELAHVVAPFIIMMHKCFKREEGGGGANAFLNL